MVVPKQSPKLLALRADVALAREHAPYAIKRLIEWIKADDARVSLAAITALLDRAYGKPALPADAGEDEQGQTFTIIKRVIVDRPANQDSQGL
jgi:hypothetical protein